MVNFSIVIGKRQLMTVHAESKEYFDQMKIRNPCRLSARSLLPAPRASCGRGVIAPRGEFSVCTT
jgi:hypothetical protein